MVVLAQNLVWSLLKHDPENPPETPFYARGQEFAKRRKTKGVCGMIALTFPASRQSNQTSQWPRTLAGSGYQSGRSVSLRRWGVCQIDYPHPIMSGLEPSPRARSWTRFKRFTAPHHTQRQCPDQPGALVHATLTRKHTDPPLQTSRPYRQITLCPPSATRDET